MNKLLPFPINFNRSKIPEFFHKFIPSIDSPTKIFSECQLSRIEFSQAVSAFRVENTWKTTSSLRHTCSDKKICELVSTINKPVILDVGVSDGITSLELIEKNRGKFSKYFVTDLYFAIFYTEQNGVLYVYNPLTHKCIMRISEFFNIYFQGKNIFPFVNYIVEKIYRRSPNFNLSSVRRLSFCQPDLVKLAEQDNKIILKDYNVLNTWTDEPVDIIKIANVLNSSYFSYDQIKQAIKNLSIALKKNGYLLVVNNGNNERWSLYQKNEQSKFTVIENYNAQNTPQDIMF